MQGDVEVLEGTAVEALTKAEIDRQVATARAFPRITPKAFVEVATGMATITEAMTGECIYALPRRDRETGTKMIQGPSARFAEIIAYAWGNCRIGGRVLDDIGEFVTAQGVFFDVERNMAVSFEVKRRITTAEGQRYSADMIAVTANAAASIAIRNAILKGIPKPVWAPVYDAVLAKLKGSAATIEGRRTIAFEHLKDRFGVSGERVLRALGVAAIGGVTDDDLVALRGIVSAINEGEVKVSDAFPETGAQSEETKGALDRVREKLAERKGRKGAKGKPSPAPEARTPAAGGSGTDAAPPAGDSDVRPMCSACTNESVRTIMGVPYCEAHLPPAGATFSTGPSLPL